MATSAMPKPASPMTKLAAKTTRAASAHTTLLSVIMAATRALESGLVMDDPETRAHGHRHADEGGAARDVAPEHVAPEHGPQDHHVLEGRHRAGRRRPVPLRQGI